MYEVHRLVLFLMNLTKLSLPQIAEQWRVKVHYAFRLCGSKRWLITTNRAEVTCLRCKENLK